tara:strand:+ start:879 stop:1895 length:1017 start_codon:yes stop_codon:yes gene_type:complete
MNATMSPENVEHFPVMLDKILSIISPQHGGTFIDCTFGGGGYSKALLKYPKTEIVALDRDILVNSKAKILSNKYKNRFKFFNSKFSEIDKISETENAKAIIFDLGFSMIQMKDLKRGFSFNSKGSLDMKMGLNSYNANDVINNLNQKEIELILKYFGEEKNYKKIAFQIVNKRKIKNLNTEDLVELIGKIRRKKFYSKINPSTKSFQALRIFVNNEISELIYGLINSVKNLKPGGILAVVTFHSLEDKIVKYFFKTYSEEKSNNSRYLPEIQNVNKKLFNLVQKKPILPSDKEISINPPSRSAKLRYVTRNENKFYFPQDLIDKFQNFIDIENIGLKL